jgi:hypothetical protein
VPAGQAAGAAAIANPGRLTLTVEEAAGLLGISRAFAYEAQNLPDEHDERLFHD